MSYINLMTNDIWSEQDILNQGRALVASVVSEARQNDLRTIMLGHVAGMRTATRLEMAEIMQVRVLTEKSALESAAARADTLLLTRVIKYEYAIETLAKPLADSSINEFVTELETIDIENNIANRAAAQAILDSASTEVLNLYTLRHPLEIVL